MTHLNDPAPLVELDRMTIDTVARTEYARLRLTFTDNAGRGRHRRAAAERLAATFGVRAERRIIVDDDWAGRDPYGPPPWTYGGRELTIIGSPVMVASFGAALPALLAELERLATIAVRAYGRWLRTSPMAEYEFAPGEHRSAMRRWRAAVFDELALIAGNPPASGGPAVFEEISLTSQARAYAYTLAPIVDLWPFVEQAAAEAILAGAHLITDPLVLPVAAVATTAAAAAEATESAEPVEPVEPVAAAAEVLEAAAEVVDAAAAELAAPSRNVPHRCATACTAPRRAAPRHHNRNHTTGGPRHDAATRYPVRPVPGPAFHRRRRTRLPRAGAQRARLRVAGMHRHGELHGLQPRLGRRRLLGRR